MNVTDEKYRYFCDSCSGVYPPDHFEGLWLETWPNGRLKYRGEFKEGGRRIGQHISFFVNGVLQEVATWNDGWICGTVLWFRSDGTKEYEKDFGEHGGVTRCWTERCYTLSGGVYATRIYRDGEIVSEQVTPEIHNLMKHINIDAIIQGEVDKLYPAGVNKEGEK